MSKRKRDKRNTPAPVEEKKQVSIITETVPSFQIRNVLSTANSKNMSGDTLYFIENGDFEKIVRILDSTPNIPVLSISGEPDIQLFFKGNYWPPAGVESIDHAEAAKLLEYLHSSDGGYSLTIFGAKPPRQTKNMAHYILGNKNPENPYSESWIIRKEFEKLSVTSCKYPVPYMALFQSYIRITGNEKKGKLNDIQTLIVNLGKTDVLEAKINGEKYVSEGIEEPWHAYLR